MQMDSGVSGSVASIIGPKLFRRAWMCLGLHKRNLLAYNSTLRCVGMGFHTDAQAIEAIARCAQCAEVMFTNEPRQEFC